MGILEVLTVIFVTMKLLGVGAVASWSWWLVFSPMYPALAIYAFVFLMAAIMNK